MLTAQRYIRSPESVNHMLLLTESNCTYSSHDAVTEHCDEAIDRPEDGIPPAPETAVDIALASSADSDDGHVVHGATHLDDEEQRAQAAPDRGYLTLSQLSPRKCEAVAGPPTTLASLSTDGAPVADLDQPVVPSTRSSERQERPPSPMRTSVKRAASPAEERDVHQRKRGKTAPNELETSSRELRPRKPPLRPSRAKNVPAAVPSGSGPTSRTRRVVSGSAKSTTDSAAGADRATKPPETTCKPSLRSSRPKTVPGGEEFANPAVQATTRSIANKASTKGSRNAAPSSSNDRSRSGHASVSQRENVPDSEERQTGGQQSGRSTSTSVDRPVSTLHAVSLGNRISCGIGRIFCFAFSCAHIPPRTRLALRYGTAAVRGSQSRPISISLALMIAHSRPKTDFLRRGRARHDPINHSATARCAGSHGIQLGSHTPISIIALPVHSIWLARHRPSIANTSCF